MCADYAVVSAPSTHHLDIQPQFTAVVALHNAVPYLAAFFTSIEAQTIPSTAVEYIIVDDASYDDSLSTAVAWAKAHSALAVTVIQRHTNGGPAAARAIGYALARGEWVTSIDPDDILDPGYFLAVQRMAHAPEAAHAAMLTTRVLMLNHTTGVVQPSHPLDFKYQAGDRFTHLTAEPTAIQLGATAFLRTRVLRSEQLEFSPRVRPSFEDGHLLCRYLACFTDPIIGLVASARYYYRRGMAAGSLVHSSWARREKYTDQIKYGYQEALLYAREQLGTVPRWLENTIIYDLSWYFTEGQKASGATAWIRSDSAVKAEFYRQLTATFSLISPEAIAEFTIRELPPGLKETLIAHFYTDRFGAVTVDGAHLFSRTNLRAAITAAVRSYSSHSSPLVIQAHYLFGDIFAYEASYDGAVLNGSGHSRSSSAGFLSDGSWPPLPFTIAHYTSANAPADADLSAAQPERTAHVAQAIAQTARVERTNPTERTTLTARETELATKESAAEQPPSFAATPIAAAHASTGTSTPTMLSTSGPSKRTIRWVRRLATGRTAAADLIAVSTRKLRELPLRAHRKMLTVSATALRLPALRTLKTRRYQGAWIISDRPQGAGDNGEHFYRFLRAEYPEIPAFFLLDPASPDRRRLAHEGFRFLPSNPLGLAAAYSQAAVFISSDWASQDIARLHRLTPPPQRVPFVFLQHGITKDDISAWLNHLPIALITTALPEEQEYLTADDSPYHLKHGEAQLTGFARFDRLHELSRKQAREPLAMQHTAMHPDFSDFNSASHTTHNDTAYAEDRGTEAHRCTPSTTRHGVSHIERSDRTLPAAHTAKCPHIAQFGGKQQLTAAHTAEHLAAHNPAHILIMPTWRRSLNDQLRTAATAEQRRQLLTDSPFLRAWAELLHTPQLAELMNSGEADVTIVLHPNLAPIAADIVAATRGTATVLDIRTVDFQEWLTRADIFLTDYSSTAFDAVVAGCEVAYFQFDRTEFFAGAHSMLPGWFDYDRDGFGPCFEDSASAASWLSQRAHARTGANTSDTPEPYASRIRALCTALPHHACANIYAAVHRLLAQRENSEGAA